MAKIAIVEDDKNISEIESFALKNSGYEVEVYGTAADFFEGIKENVFHLIMLDIKLKCTERCPSGLRCKPGTFVWGQLHRGFESHPFRTF